MDGAWVSESVRDKTRTGPDRTGPDLRTNIIIIIIIIIRDFTTSAK